MSALPSTIYSPETEIFKFGFAVLSSVVPTALIERMRKDMDRAYEILRPMQIAAGLGEETVGALHHLPAIMECESFRHFLEVNPVASHIADYFDAKPYTLQSFGGNFNYPSAENYANNVHRDQRSFFRDRMMLNTLVCLDGMDQSNGGTWLMPYSHKQDRKPTDDEWTRGAAQVSAPAGSILMWDSRVWHRAGINRSDKPRRILSPIFCRPPYKPEFDYARAMGGQPLSATLRQVLGVNARTPMTFGEFYQPPENRMYLKDQG